ncbi:2-C-methyl-D-erythritol 4-phosphate cytidylyltransferase [Solitalea canadensis]|uniref:2-C-methyl-D-erythritol 4-phosphate cytidylyltransferase n=1 Tax=Solitalea canadensis (strain ATCC 29591 / DSM 3403 / JCM 21819 / LMG 8368 / NBRC 15130 / NCIMB 12057 / USAM 9D) TaxID=929556 RepID=H8KR03_SOLCM|nr:2-C-methyl-D-erythritol 4-phosphate cytidylyltransferase [Solitalea canadensis]AFD07149.1 2-C-methyl-D-erythritol 4-phosphate cytidylyltransferase [Solitalea canadensis DSM 3403]
MTYYAIIVAGGTGSRMGAQVPKQFLELKGLPILMHSIKAFYQWPLVPKIILVMHPDYHEHWKKLCDEHKFTTPHTLISGGKTRFESVKNGLSVISSPGIVAVHDAVRPLADHEFITRLFQQAQQNGNAIPAVKCRDSIRKVENGVSVSLNREHYYLVQTPQCFTTELLLQAYEQPFREEFTDDASVVEAMGTKILLAEGEYKNIKITYPEDLIFAEAIMRG